MRYTVGTSTKSFTITLIKRLLHHHTADNNYRIRNRRFKYCILLHLHTAI